MIDIAKHKELDRADHVIQNWMRNRNTIDIICPRWGGITMQKVQKIQTLECWNAEVL